MYDGDMFMAVYKNFTFRLSYSVNTDIFFNSALPYIFANFFVMFFNPTNQVSEHFIS